MPSTPVINPEFADDVNAISRIGAVEKILEVICRTTGMGFSAVARVTESRWVACAVRDQVSFGLKPGSELPLQTTICDEIRDSRQLVVIDHVANDPVFCDHHTPKTYGLQSYISVPIILTNGNFFGTLCAIDSRPAKVNTPETIGMFTLFADLIAHHLDANDRATASEKALLTERETAQLREQFIAILGHDLRNPLAAIHSGTALLKRLPHDQTSETVLGIMQRSVSRMTDLINNVMDFARGRLGGGFKVHRIPTDGLAAILEQVVSELRTSLSSRQIESDIRLDVPIACDSSRIAQMFSNLLANALTHGDADGSVSVKAAVANGEFVMSIANTGQTIPPEKLRTLFEPFVRGAEQNAAQGLGLGLYIASEIARAHGGAISVTSAEGKTAFTFRMPVATKAE